MFLMFVPLADLGGKRRCGEDTGQEKHMLIDYTARSWEISSVLPYPQTASLAIQSSVETLLCTFVVPTR